MTRCIRHEFTGFSPTGEDRRKSQKLTVMAPTQSKIGGVESYREFLLSSSGRSDWVILSHATFKGAPVRLLWSRRSPPGSPPWRAQWRTWSPPAPCHMSGNHPATSSHLMNKNFRLVQALYSPPVLLTFLATSMGHDTVFETRSSTPAVCFRQGKA